MPQRLLVVDDDPLFRTALRHWLDETGYEVIEADDSASAIKQFTEGHPQGVLLDLMLGEKDSLELLATMKALRPHIPVLVISAKAHAHHAAQAFKAGAWDYLIKPLPNLELLHQSIQNCLEQSRLHERMRATQARLYTLVQNLPIVLFSFTKHLEFTFLTRKTEHVLGYSVAELHNYPLKFLHLIHKDDRKNLLRNISNIFAQKYFEAKMDFRFTHKDGYPLVLQVYFVAQHHEDHIHRVEGFLLDITRHTYLDRMLRSNERQLALHTLAQELAHEVRNPLVAVGGLVRLLRERYPGVPEIDLLIQECERLDGVWERLEPLLDPQPAATEPINLGATLAFVFRIFSDNLERAGIAWEIEETPLPPVWGSPELTHRALLSVIQQGLESVPSGGRIYARLVHDDTSAGVDLELSPVHPTAPPFAPQYMEVCRRIMRRQNGTMELTSGPGMTVHLRLPRAHPGLVSSTTFS